MRIFTIGYEGATVGEFLAALEKAGVKRVIDVRALPSSRRPGFSKSPLGAALGEAGIDYVHLKALGTPLRKRYCSCESLVTRSVSATRYAPWYPTLKLWPPVT